MGTIYILGAGFSRTCGIATDLEMLDALEPLLEKESPKGGGIAQTSIQYLKDQNFRDSSSVGFEQFMSTLSALKFSAEYMEADRNVFREEEKEIRKALKKYLKKSVEAVNWECEGKVISCFLNTIDWDRDFVLTFNYDLLLEKAAERQGLDIRGKTLHMHGSLGEKTLAWPTYTKFAYRTTKQPLGPRWKKAFHVLRDQRELDRLVFIGYSMPPSDLEAKSLFNYSDFYNSMKGNVFYEGQIVRPERQYSYDVVVINPSPEISANYKFFRKTPIFKQLTLAEWMKVQGK